MAPPYKRKLASTSRWSKAHVFGTHTVAKTQGWKVTGAEISSTKVFHRPTEHRTCSCSVFGDHHFFIQKVVVGNRVLVQVVERRVPCHVVENRVLVQVVERRVPCQPPG